jgi:hypothetical protein
MILHQVDGNPVLVDAGVEEEGQMGHLSSYP